MADANTVRVAVCGASGKMGKEVVKAVLADPQLSLVAAIDRFGVGIDAATGAGCPEPCGVAIQADLVPALKATNAQVCVDFTHPDGILANTLATIEAGVRPVVGTTGLSPENLNTIEAALQKAQLGGMVVPNFAIGAVLMMKFAQQAAQYFDHAEIIELHHNRKADAPSGTAIKTAELMSEGLQASGKQAFVGSEVAETETHTGARGARVAANVHIHSVRLPGLVAHQEVILGGPGQILTLRHDSMDRTSFMPGVVLAVKRVMDLTGLVYGLEHIL
jgi:4-hydroxy-tetrahydrodipicolinate reductase